MGLIRRGLSFLDRTIVPMAWPHRRAKDLNLRPDETELLRSSWTFRIIGSVKGSFWGSSPDWGRATLTSARLVYQTQKRTMYHDLKGDEFLEIRLDEIRDVKLGKFTGLLGRRNLEVVTLDGTSYMFHLAQAARWKRAMESLIEATPPP